MPSKKAELGISALIILSATILVSGIIFVAFLTSTNQVSQEARSVGMTVRSNIGTAMTVVKMYAEDGSSGADVDYFYQEIKPPYASDEIKLNQTLLIMGLANTSREYTYSNVINCNIKDVGNESSIYNDSNDNYFGVQYVDGGATYTDRIIAGELVRLCWKSPESVHKNEKVITTFFAQAGYTCRLESSFDKLISDKTIYFFP